MPQKKAINQILHVFVYFQICRIAYEMMQFHRGDTTQCLSAVDGTYCNSQVGASQYKVAIRNYTFTIPIQNALSYHGSQSIAKERIIELIREHQKEGCEIYAHRYPYRIEDSQLVVTPIEQRDMITMIECNWLVASDYEIGYNQDREYNVCYPSDLVLDYLSGAKLKLHNKPPLS